MHVLLFCASQAEPDNFNVEFSHEQLYGFFQQLDQIQEQLDNLSG